MTKYAKLKKKLKEYFFDSSKNRQIWKRWLFGECGTKKLFSTTTSIIPIFDAVLHKYYKDVVSLTIMIDESGNNIDQGITPAYKNMKGQYVPFTKEMISNEAFLDEMLSVKFVNNIVEDIIIGNEDKKL